MSAHAPFSPSGFERVWLCPGSLLAERAYPDYTTEYAAEGTFAHTIRELCLNHDLDVEDFLGYSGTADGYPFTVTKDMCRFLQPGIDRIREFGGTWFFETRVNAEKWILDMWGTLDAGGFNDELIIIDDLKYGRGYRVDAFRCMQLMIYAVAFWHQIARHKTKAKKFLLRIDQPRMPGGTSEWYTTLEELLAFMEEAIVAAQRALQPNAERNPSPTACKFCRCAANADCYALDAYVLDLLGLSFDQIDYQVGRIYMPNPEKIDPLRRQTILENSKVIESWLKGIYAVSLGEAVSGGKTPGYKAVETLGDREWRDVEEAEQFLRSKLPKDKCYTAKLLSPAQAENILGTRNWKKAEELIMRSPGRPALVPVSDPRPALIPAVNLFDEFPADEEAAFDDLAYPDIEDLI
jgi:hypothetical protein